MPAKISRALGDDKYIPVKGDINGIPFRSTLTPRGKGLYRLFIHSSIWKKLGLDNGDKIRITLEPDKKPDGLEIPDDIRESLLKNDKAWEIFESLTTRMRNSYISYINQAKTVETREKRLELGIERLLERSTTKRK